MEVRVEELLGHGHRHPRAKSRRQRGEDDGGVQVTLMIGGENDRAAGLAQVFEPLDVDPREQPRERQQRQGQARAPRQGGWPASAPRRHDPVTVNLACRGRHQRQDVADASGLGKPALVDRRIESVLDRRHELDPIERTEPEFFDRRFRPQAAPTGVAREQSLERRAGARRADGDLSRLGPPSNLAAFELASALGSGQRRPREDRDAANALVVGQDRIRRPDDSLDVGARLDDDDGVHAFFAVAGEAHDRRLDDSRLRVDDALHIIGKDIQPIGRDDHFLLAALDEQSPLRVELADVARVEPTVLERLGRLALGAVSSRG